jgi:hypothetical protein
LGGHFDDDGHHHQGSSRLNRNNHNDSPNYTPTYSNPTLHSDYRSEIDRITSNNKLISTAFHNHDTTAKLHIDKKKAENVQNDQNDQNNEFQIPAEFADYIDPFGSDSDSDDLGLAALMGGDNSTTVMSGGMTDGDDTQQQNRQNQEDQTSNKNPEFLLCIISLKTGLLMYETTLANFDDVDILDLIIDPTYFNILKNFSISFHLYPTYTPLLTSHSRSLSKSLAAPIPTGLLHHQQFKLPITTTAEHAIKQLIIPSTLSWHPTTNIIAVGRLDGRVCLYNVVLSSQRAPAALLDLGDDGDNDDNDDDGVAEMMKLMMSAQGNQQQEGNEEDVRGKKIKEFLLGEFVAIEKGSVLAMSWFSYDSSLHSTPSNILYSPDLDDIDGSVDFDKTNQHSSPTNPLFSQIFAQLSYQTNDVMSLPLFQLTTRQPSSAVPFDFVTHKSKLSPYLPDSYNPPGGDDGDPFGMMVGSQESDNDDNDRLDFFKNFDKNDILYQYSRSLPLTHIPAGLTQGKPNILMVLCLDSDIDAINTTLPSFRPETSPTLSEQETPGGSIRGIIGNDEDIKERLVLKYYLWGWLPIFTTILPNSFLSHFNQEDITPVDSDLGIICDSYGNPYGVEAESGEGNIMVECNHHQSTQLIPISSSNLPLHNNLHSVQLFFSNRSPQASQTHPSPIFSIITPILPPIFPPPRLYNHQLPALPLNSHCFDYLSYSTTISMLIKLLLHFQNSLTLTNWSQYRARFDIKKALSGLFEPLGELYSQKEAVFPGMDCWWDEEFGGRAKKDNMGVEKNKNDGLFGKNKQNRVVGLDPAQNNTHPTEFSLILDPINLISTTQLKETGPQLKPIGYVLDPGSNLGVINPEATRSLKTGQQVYFFSQNGQNGPNSQHNSNNYLIFDKNTQFTPNTQTKQISRGLASTNLITLRTFLGPLKGSKNTLDKIQSQAISQHLFKKHSLAYLLDPIFVDNFIKRKIYYRKNARQTLFLKHLLFKHTKTKRRQRIMRAHDGSFVALQDKDNLHDDYLDQNRSNKHQNNPKASTIMDDVGYNHNKIIHYDSSDDGDDGDDSDVDIFGLGSSSDSDSKKNNNLKATTHHSAQNKPLHTFFPKVGSDNSDGENGDDIFGLFSSSESEEEQPQQPQHQTAQNNMGQKNAPINDPKTDQPPVSRQLFSDGDDTEASESDMFGLFDSDGDGDGDGDDKEELGINHVNNTSQHSIKKSAQKSSPQLPKCDNESSEELNFFGLDDSDEQEDIVQKQGIVQPNQKSVQSVQKVIERSSIPLSSSDSDEIDLFDLDTTFEPIKTPPGNAVIINQNTTSQNQISTENDPFGELSFDLNSTARRNHELQPNLEDQKGQKDQNLPRNTQNVSDISLSFDLTLSSFKSSPNLKKTADRVVGQSSNLNDSNDSILDLFNLDSSDDEDEQTTHKPTNQQNISKMVSLSFQDHIQPISIQTPDTIDDKRDDITPTTNLCLQTNTNNNLMNDSDSQIDEEDAFQSNTDLVKPYDPFNNDDDEDDMNLQTVMVDPNFYKNAEKMKLLLQAPVKAQIQPTQQADTRNIHHGGVVGADGGQNNVQNLGKNDQNNDKNVNSSFDQSCFNFSLGSLDNSLGSLNNSTNSLDQTIGLESMLNSISNQQNQNQIKNNQAIKQSNDKPNTIPQPVHGKGNASFLSTFTLDLSSQGDDFDNQVVNFSAQNKSHKSEKNDQIGQINGVNRTQESQFAASDGTMINSTTVTLSSISSTTAETPAQNTFPQINAPVKAKNDKKKANENQIEIENMDKNTNFQHEKMNNSYQDENDDLDFSFNLDLTGFSGFGSIQGVDNTPVNKFKSLNNNLSHDNNPNHQNEQTNTNNNTPTDDSRLSFNLSFLSHSSKSPVHKPIAQPPQQLGKKKGKEQKSKNLPTNSNQISDSSFSFNLTKDSVKIESPHTSHISPDHSPVPQQRHINQQPMKKKKKLFESNDNKKIEPNNQSGNSSSLGSFPSHFSKKLEQPDPISLPLSESPHMMNSFAFSLGGDILAEDAMESNQDETGSTNQHTQTNSPQNVDSSDVSIPLKTAESIMQENLARQKPISYCDIITENIKQKMGDGGDQNDQNDQNNAKKARKGTRISKADRTIRYSKLIKNVFGELDGDSSGFEDKKGKLMKHHNLVQKPTTTPQFEQFSEQNRAKRKYNYHQIVRRRLITYSKRSKALDAMNELVRDGQIEDLIIDEVQCIDSDEGKNHQICKGGNGGNGDNLKNSKNSKNRNYSASHPNHSNVSKLSIPLIAPSNDCGKFDNLYLSSNLPNTTKNAPKTSKLTPAIPSSLSYGPFSLKNSHQNQDVFYNVRRELLLSLPTGGLHSQTQGNQILHDFFAKSMTPIDTRSIKNRVMFYDSHADAYLTTAQRSFETMVQIFDHLCGVLLNYYQNQSQIFQTHCQNNHHNNPPTSFPPHLQYRLWSQKIITLFNTHISTLCSYLLTFSNTLLNTLSTRQRYHHGDLESLCGLLSIYTAYAHRPTQHKIHPHVDNSTLLTSSIRGDSTIGSNSLLSSLFEFDPNIDYTLYIPQFEMNDIDRVSKAIQNVIRSGYIPAIQAPVQTCLHGGVDMGSVSSLKQSEPSLASNLQHHIRSSDQSLWQLIPNFSTLFEAIVGEDRTDGGSGICSCDDVIMSCGRNDADVSNGQPQYSFLVNFHDDDDCCVEEWFQVYEETIRNEKKTVCQNCQNKTPHRTNFEQFLTTNPLTFNYETSSITKTPSLLPHHCFDGGCTKCIDVIIQKITNELLLVMHTISDIISMPFN